MSARLRSCTRITSPGQNVSWSLTGRHCVLSEERTSTFPSTAIALAIAGSQVAANDGAENRKTVTNPVQVTRAEQVVHRFIAPPIAHLIVLRYVLHYLKTTALRSFAPPAVLKIAGGLGWLPAFHSVSGCLLAASAPVLRHFTQAANPHRWVSLI